MLVAVPIDPRAQGSLVDTQLAGDFGGRSLGLDHHLHRLFTVFRSELTIFRHNDPSSSGDILPYWVTVRWEPHTPRLWRSWVWRRWCCCCRTRPEPERRRERGRGCRSYGACGGSLKVSEGDWKPPGLMD